MSRFVGPVLVWTVVTLSALQAMAARHDRGVPVEFELTADQTYADPVRDVELWAVATGPGGVSVRVPGFWDGGQTWRIRFRPNVEGAWTIRTEARPVEDAGLHGRTFNIQAEAYVGINSLIEHGPVRVADNGTHLVHADGEPFFWLADTAWNGALRGSEAGWKDYLDDRVRKRFTAIQFITSPWRAAVADRDGNVAWEGTDRIQIVPKFFQRLDRQIAAINERGLLAAPVLLWAIADKTGRSPGSNLSDDQAILLVRYIVARYQAQYVAWILAGDGDYRGDRASRWCTIGRAVFDSPETSLVAMHSGGMHWVAKEFRNEPWFDFLLYQSGHGDSAAALKWLCQGPPSKEWMQEPIKPLINGEPNYEGHIAYQSKQPIRPLQVRRAMWWSCLVTPTAGVTYGAHGVWNFGDEDEVPLEHPTSGVAQAYQRAMRLPGSEMATHLRTILETVPWWNLRPAQDLLYSQPGTKEPEKFVMAAMSREDRVAVVYMPGGLGIDLNSRRIPGALEDADWYNPRTGERKPNVRMHATKGVRLIVDTPGDGDEDWVLILRWKDRS